MLLMTNNFYDVIHMSKCQYFYSLSRIGKQFCYIYLFKNILKSFLIINYEIYETMDFYLLRDVYDIFSKQKQLLK